MLSPCKILRALAFVLHERHGVSARLGNASDFDQDYRTSAVIFGEILSQARKLAFLWFYDSTLAMQPQNLRGTLKGAKHDEDASVFLHVSDCFDAAADEVHIRDRARPQNPKRVESFRRQVDVPLRTQRSRRHEKHVLFLNKFSDTLIDF